ncbi:hypothetical protein [Chitinophaga flava]|uniref:Membrane or secreted protein n=1 Tax=Chitinophaga flava TaxID=2259036 RepID=A0A365Y0A6_9BACT|nr:hypothetical protein [Chitinophaga flava]RBL91265.1 hypothetical protein DF182_01170 [Chitinophaga flava]
MKKVFLIMLLLGGTVATTYAQRGWGHGYGHEKHCDKWERKYWKERDRDCRRWEDDDCYRPRRRVVYAEPAYYPVAVPVPVPPPPPRPYYAPRPRAVFHAGVTIAN